MKGMLMGIGNRDRGDDAVGPLVADGLTHPDWLPMDCGTAPENFTGVVRKHRPDRLVMVDATHMDLPPGAIRRIARGRIEDVGVGTHMLPLYHVIDYLADAVGRTIVIGVQPADTAYGAPMHPDVRRAVDAILAHIRDETLEQIPALGSPS